MSDTVNNSARGRGIDRAQVVGQCEHRPVVANSAEVGVLGVGQRAVVDELSADDGVLAGLEGGAFNLYAKSAFRR